MRCTFKKTTEGTGELPQPLRALIALAEDSGSAPNTQAGAPNHLSLQLQMPSSALCRHQAHM